MVKHLILILSLSFTFTAFGQHQVSDRYKIGVQKGDEYNIPLKNGYTLIYKDEDEDTIPAEVSLKHGKAIKRLTAFFNIWVWLEMDGSNYFMTGSGGRGSGNPEDINVFKKSSGINTFSSEAYILYADTLNGIIVFDDEGRGEDNRCFILYNLNTNTYEVYKEPNDGQCADCADYWNVITVTNTTLKVSYEDNNGKTKTVEYPRKRNEITFGKTREDSTQIINKMIIGTWVDVSSPLDIWIISTDTVEQEGDCWLYKIDIEKPLPVKIVGEYWFGFSYTICGDSLKQYFGNISIDGTYMKFHDFSSETTFVFKQKK